MRWISRHALILGLCFVLFSNMGLWAAVYWNRLGAPESTLVLSERELRTAHQSYAPLHPVDKEGNVKSAIRFRLLVANESNQNDAYQIPWEKMKTMGFDPGIVKTIEVRDTFYFLTISKKNAFAVLELDGLARQQLIDEKEAFLATCTTGDSDRKRQNICNRTAHRLKNLKTTDSRLFIVDVGLDKEALRTAYPNRSRYAIVHATIGPSRQLLRVRDTNTPPPQFTGEVNEVRVSEISLPLEWHEDSLYQRGSHFEASVSFGQRLEPWLTAFKVEQPETSN